MNWTTFDKALVAAVGVALMVLNNILPIVPAADVMYVNLAIGILTPIGVFLKSNKNTAALKPGQVVVPESQVQPGATIVQRRQP